MHLKLNILALTLLSLIGSTVELFSGIVDYPSIIEGCEPALIASGYTEEYHEANLGYDPEIFISMIERGLFASALVYEYTGRTQLYPKESPDMSWLTDALQNYKEDNGGDQIDCLYWVIAEQPAWRDVWRPHVENVVLQEATLSLRLNVRLMHHLERIVSVFSLRSSRDDHEEDY